MRGGRVDANHAAVRDEFRRLGWVVEDLSHIGHGVPDLYCEKGDKYVFAEVKDGNKPPSKRRLTEDEVFWHEILRRAGVTVRIIERVEDVAAL